MTLAAIIIVSVLTAFVVHDLLAMRERRRALKALRQDQRIP